jgi:probable phosphoglycerate mutase
MTAGTVVLLRHGRTEWNLVGRLQGQSDVPLDAVGRWQAGEAGRHLARGHRATRVVASDLSRAVDTARAYADLVGAEVLPDVRLRERAFGKWEGLTDAQIAADWPQEHAAWRGGHDVDGVPPGGETRGEVGRRVLEAVTEHAAAVEDGGTLVVVSHGAALTTGLTALLGLDPDAWRGVVGLTNAHWSELRRSRGGLAPEWRLVTHNVGAGYAPEEWHAGPATGVEQEPDTTGMG